MPRAWRCMGSRCAVGDVKVDPVEMARLLADAIVAAGLVYRDQVTRVELEMLIEDTLRRLAREVTP